MESDAWSLRDLRRPRTLISSVITLVVAIVGGFVVTCNVHELGHVLVAVPLGWKVERLHFCLPGGGGVEYSHVGTWAGNAQGYAGGAAAVLFLLATYLLFVARRARPARSPQWWVVGLSVALLVGPQVVIAVVEGTTPAGEDYTQRFDEAPALVVLVVATAALGGAVYVWRWRSVLRTNGSSDTT